MVATKMQVYFIWKLQKLGPVRWVDLFTELFSWWLRVGKEKEIKKKYIQMNAIKYISITLYWSDNDKTLVFHFILKP